MYTKEGNGGFIVIDGVLEEYNGSDTSIVIPSTVKVIGNSVFEYSDITSVIIPDSVQKIEDSAFRESKITSIAIPNSVKTIGESAFFHCEDLLSVKLPSKIKNISNNLFGGCEELCSVEIPDGVIKIGAGAFAWCESLEEIELPDSLAKIGREAFSGCGSLKTIVVHLNLTKIEGGLYGGVFNGCPRLSHIIPKQGIKTYKGSPLELIWERVHIEYSTKNADVRFLNFWLGEFFHIIKDDEAALKKVKTFKNQIIDACIDNDNAQALINLLSLFKPLKLDEIIESTY
jgi:hypothetical protein